MDAVTDYLIVGQTVLCCISIRVGNCKYRAVHAIHDQTAARRLDHVHHN